MILNLLITVGMLVVVTLLLLLLSAACIEHFPHGLICNLIPTFIRGQCFMVPIFPKEVTDT